MDINYKYIGTVEQDFFSPIQTRWKFKLSKHNKCTCDMYFDKFSTMHEVTSILW